MNLDEECYREHIAAPAFQDGVARGWWLDCPEAEKWPNVLIRLTLPPRPNSPDFLHLRFELTGYPGTGPTATLWDVGRNAKLESAKWPKGVGDVAKAFRTDWEDMVALYAPWDRRAFAGHTDWPQKHPGRCWKPTYTIAHYLRFTRELLDSDDYHGC